MPLSRRRRQRVLDRAQGRCEYCQIDGWDLTVDHVIPRSAWTTSLAHGAAPDSDDNLAAACAPCNRAKWSVTTAVDVVTGLEARLFNPRRDDWDEHFAWADDFTMIYGLTPIGRATVEQLRLNRDLYRYQRRILRAAARAGASGWP